MSQFVKNVLRVNEVEEQTAYRSAVATILLDIQRETGDTLIDIAEKISVSLGTISNAANKKNDLSVTFLNRIGKVYGPSFLNPYAALCGGQITPLSGNDTTDILPFLARANAKIAEARCPTSPGGTRELHSEQLAYLPYLKALQRELSGIVVKIEEIAA